MSNDDGWEDNPRITSFPANNRPLTEDEAEALISHLAALTAVKYEQEREGAAAKLRMRLGVLDKIVKAAQERHQEEGPQLERKPWPTAVGSTELISELIADLTRYVSLEPYYAAVAAVWTLHTYLVSHVFISPRLAITAPQPRCGKF